MGTLIAGGLSTELLSLVRSGAESSKMFALVSVILHSKPGTVQGCSMPSRANIESTLLKSVGGAASLLPDATSAEPVRN